MLFDQSVAFVDRLIVQTKKKQISWHPIKSVAESVHIHFPELAINSSYYFEIENAIIATGKLNNEFVQYTDVDIFVYLEETKTYSIHQYTEIKDGNDLDVLCSKIFRLYNLLTTSDCLLDNFMSNYLRENH